ncbi:hypothetical protein AB0G04_36050 [Actinoplanes sp. NPDC023801]|uniref:hypothetical protein n=1 Tax=Actinoplanes sp. NPDC023801 TaxID=3154595 RepID=UPI00340483C6
MWTRIANVLVLVLAGSMLAGCPSDDPVQRNYLSGLARIGDDYQLFAPMCQGDRLLQVTVSAVNDSGDETAWWQAGGPKEPDGPGEFLVLGRDDPFREIAVRAGANAKQRGLPADITMTLVHTNRYGTTYHNSARFRRAAVPSYPAGADSRQIRYMAPGIDGGDLGTPDEIRRRSDCGADRADDVTAAPRLQPAGSFRPGAAERVKAAMLDRDVITWLEPAGAAPHPDEDVAAHVCDNGPGSGAFVAAFGQTRDWWDRDSGGFSDERAVRQFVGAYGAVTAADAITQVNGQFSCDRYTDFGNDYTSVGRVGLPELPGVERQLLYCEQDENENGRCTLLLARGDILSRLVVKAATEADAERDARALADDAAAALARI